MVPTAADDYVLEQYREYLRLLASQQIALRFRGKIDPSGIVQDTLWEAHRELERGANVPSGERLPWLRRILANNLADEARKLTADKRDIGREASLEQAVEHSSQRLEEWLAREIAPGGPIEYEEQVLQLIAALSRLPSAQREALLFHYWTGWTLTQIAEHLGRTRDAVAGLIKRGLKQMREEMGAAPLAHLPNRRASHDAKEPDNARHD